MRYPALSSARPPVAAAAPVAPTQQELMELTATVVPYLVTQPIVDLAEGRVAGY